MKVYLTRHLICGLLATGLAIGPNIELTRGWTTSIGAAWAQTGPDDGDVDDEVQMGGKTTANYSSPYTFKYAYKSEKLLSPDRFAPRDRIEDESLTPADRWYSREVRERYGSWGPEPRHYPAPKVSPELLNDPAWRRQRLLAVGEKFIGLPYQHHHIPNWNPPPDWPWKEVAWGRQSPGIDCSNFSSWLYNYGLGIKLLTNVHKQAEATSVAAPDDMGTLPIQTIPACENYETLVKSLAAGDLLYIKNREGKISHVIMWAGEYGVAPDGKPLVLDSTGSGHRDSNGNDIPVGVHLRPFTPDSWYFKSFSHAHRIIN